MTTIFIILIILCSVVLGFIVLVQNPKGGGLAGTLGGFSNQFMGVKQTTDVLEKGTWIFASAIAALCIFSVFFISSASAKDSGASGAKIQQNAPPPGSLPITTPPAANPTTPK